MRCVCDCGIGCCSHLAVANHMLYYTQCLSSSQARDPIPQFRKYMLDNKIFTEEEIKAMDAEVMEVVEDSVRFAEESPKPDRGQLLENVFADPKGFGIAADGQYRYLAPGFSSGTAEVS